LFKEKCLVVTKFKKSRLCDEKDRRQKTEDRGQKTEDRGQNLACRQAGTEDR
jgi:hypothetical protein